MIQLTLDEAKQLLLALYLSELDGKELVMAPLLDKVEEADPGFSMEDFARDSGV